MGTEPPIGRRRRAWGIDPARRSAPAAWILALAAVAVASAIVCAFFLSVYRAEGLRVPIGWDQAEYLWRTNLARHVGLAESDVQLPSMRATKSARPAFPLLAATLSALEGIHPFRLASVLPAVMAATIGLAAAAFAGGVLRRSAWEATAVGLGVAISPLVLRLMAPEAYMDTMFATAVFLVAAVAVVLAVEERAPMLPALLLLGAGAVIHWSFFGVVAVALLLTAAFFVPTSLRAARGGAGLLETPAARLAAMTGGAAGLGAAMLLGVLGNSLRSPRLDVFEFATKIRRDLPKHRLPVTVPLAAAGAVVLAREGGDGRPRLAPARRTSLVLLLAWCAVVVLAFAAERLLGLPLPLHRFLSFAVALPLLASLGVLAVARALPGRARILAPVLVVVALVALGSVMRGEWLRVSPWTNVQRLEDAGWAASYLEAAGVPHDRPVVFVVARSGWSGTALLGHHIRAALPPERLPHAYLYAGSPTEYVSGATVDDRIWLRYYREVRPLLHRRPVVLVLESYNHAHYRNWVRQHPEAEIGGRLAVVRGPAPPEAVPPPGPPDGLPLGRLRARVLFVLAGVTLAALLVVGLGWSIAAFGRRLAPLHLAAAAPACAVAALVPVGIVMDRLGVALDGAGGAAIPVVAAAGGWGAALLRARASRRRDVGGQPDGRPVAPAGTEVPGRA